MNAIVLFRGEVETAICEMLVDVFWQLQRGSAAADLVEVEK